MTKCNIDGCGWQFVGDDEQEALIQRVKHLRSHFPDPDQEFHGDNLDLIKIAHDALHLIDTTEMGGWYSSQIDRMRGDACEILGAETDEHPRTALPLDHSTDSKDD